MQSGNEYYSIKHEIAKLVEEFSLKRFGKEITAHLFHGRIFNGDFFIVHGVSDKVESTVEVFGSLAAWLATILFNENSTLVVLIEYGILVTLSLHFEERVGPENDWHEVICSNQFIFCGAASVELLFVGGVEGYAFSKRHANNSLTAHVRMRSMGPVRPPLGNRNGVRA
jgi:hypothetical protein